MRPVRSDSCLLREHGEYEPQRGQCPKIRQGSGYGREVIRNDLAMVGHFNSFSLCAIRVEIYLVTGFKRYGVCLTGVLGHQGVHVVDNIHTDGCGENCLKF